MTESRTYKPTTSPAGYTPDQMDDAKKLAQIILSVTGKKRSTFNLMVESMIMGAEIAERQHAEIAERQLRLAEMMESYFTATSNTT